MASSNRTPFQDLTNKDPKEAKRQRDREYYAKHKDEINRRKRQARELKKRSTARANEENTLCDLPATGQSGVTQFLGDKTPAGGMAPNVQQNYASHIPEPDSSQLHGAVSLVGSENSRAAGLLPQISGVEAVEGCSNVFFDQPGASLTQSDECGPVTDLTDNHNNQIRVGKKQQRSQNWYARLDDEKKAEYIQRQSISRKQSKAATQSGVNYVEVSQTPVTPLPCSRFTPLSNITNINANGMDHQCATTLGTCDMVHQSYTSKDTNGIGEIGSAYDGTTRDLHRRCSESVTLDDESDWLHRNSSYMRDMRCHTRVC